MISASKSTLSLNNLKILRPKVTKNLTNLCKQFCESPPRFLMNKGLGVRLRGQIILSDYWNIYAGIHKFLTNI